MANSACENETRLQTELKLFFVKFVRSEIRKKGMKFMPAFLSRNEVRIFVKMSDLSLTFYSVTLCKINEVLSVSQASGEAVRRTGFRNDPVGYSSTGLITSPASYPNTELACGQVCWRKESKGKPMTQYKHPANNS
ncbi:unnamed protein product [Hermetia illucens]|uniref:Uncharacterized protein n=1 Tax=Hermetia illucens TaxID=343691 RepID=A0A7R8YXI8_HERIL|nr:unnamed protein product [Hermetia illucens]